MQSEDKWYKIGEEIEEFMYGDKGILTTAFADENLDTYLLDMELVIKVLKELKEIEELQGELSEKQKEKLSLYKTNLLEIENGKNNINQMYNEISRIYSNIEEY